MTGQGARLEAMSASLETDQIRVGARNRHDPRFLTMSTSCTLRLRGWLPSRSGIDWIIDRYYIKTDKDSGIVNDPNQWGLERGDPRYIVDLIKRVVTVSVRTVEIVAGLPSLDETIARLGGVGNSRRR